MPPRTWKDAPYWIPALFFVVMWGQACFFGPTDDEAYYWVLAQRPALGYAYHPPVVAWLIALSEKVFSLFGLTASVATLRFPGVACAAGLLALALAWLRQAGVGDAGLRRGALVLLSFGGLFGMSWMMVPDLPLFLAWMVLWKATWDLCFNASKDSVGKYATIVGATALCILSKYSGVFAALSSLLCLIFWAEPARRGKGALALVLGGVLAAIPILAWNASHEWASILYQIRDRHAGGSLSLARYGRFWAAEILFAGPLLVGFLFYLGFGVVRRKVADRPSLFALVWALPPALVFCLQPLWADFKPHWAFVVWWPMALALAWVVGCARAVRGLRVQVGWGFAVAGLIVVSCHFPIAGWVMKAMGRSMSDPRLDVSNDLYGWSDLGSALSERKLVPGIPVVGSRYQTASQAAFALAGVAPVTLLPRDVKARDEWPDLGVTEGIGPSWPRLVAPVLYVADNRYDEAPGFPGSACVGLDKLESLRFGLPAKTITVWRCEPAASRL